MSAASRAGVRPPTTATPTTIRKYAGSTAPRSASPRHGRTIRVNAIGPTIEPIRPASRRRPPRPETTGGSPPFWSMRSASHRHVRRAIELPRDVRHHHPGLEQQPRLEPQRTLVVEHILPPATHDVLRDEDRHDVAGVFPVQTADVREHRIGEIAE